MIRAKIKKSSQNNVAWQPIPIMFQLRFGASAVREKFAISHEIWASVYRTLESHKWKVKTNQPMEVKTKQFRQREVSLKYGVGVGCWKG